jgi:hypothetical protein
MMKQQPKTDDDASTMRGKTDVANANGFVEWHSKLETLPSDAGAKWSYLLDQRVTRVRAAVANAASDADLETVPDVHPEADRLEITVRNGQYSWVVYKGTEAVGQGVISSATNKPLKAPTNSEVAPSSSKN